jgi:acyl-homoserine-lactone acylase
MDTKGENPRGVHAQKLLQGKKDFTIESLNQAAYDSFLPAFAQLIPTLLSAYAELPPSNVLKAQLADQIQLLREWDYRWSVHSDATTLAVLWGDQLWNEVKEQAEHDRRTIYEQMADHTSGEQKLSALASISERLQSDFGTWRVPWGEMNRLQRVSGDIVQSFSDAQPSIPVGFTSALWGSLASFGARRHEGTNKYYGTSGNSFVAIVEFGDKVSARAVSIGGESGDPKSIHFGDQSARYADGSLREIYFYPAQLTGHTERAYHPH